MATLLGVLLVAVVGFALFFAVAAGASWGRVRRERDEVAGLLRAFLERSLDGDAWQSFLAHPIPDGDLDRVRKACLFLEEEFPPEHPGERCSEAGRRRVRELLEALDPDAVPDDEPPVEPAVPSER